MKRFSEEIVHFFHRQNFVIASTIDRGGSIHSSCKGIVEISRAGRVYLLDLYKGRTYENLKRNSQITVTAVDEHKFKGFSLKGKAKIVKGSKLSPQIISSWEKRLTRRITQRVLKNIGGMKGHPRHPEARLPKPEYLIDVEVKEAIDLTPPSI